MFAPGPLYARESACVHWVGRWISLRTDLDAVQKRKLCEPAWNKTVVIQPLSVVIVYSELPHVIKFNLEQVHFLY
jgi:hypothetical protein